MKIPEKFLEVIEHEGPVSIVSFWNNIPHVSNTWNSYIHITENNDLLIPAGGMKQTELNIIRNNELLLTFGSREVKGLHSMGAGFLIKATACFLYGGQEVLLMKERFSWLRAVLKVTPIEITQTL